MYNTLKPKFDKFRKLRGKKGKTRVQLEVKLREYCITRPSYHGGDLTGTKVKVLLPHIDELFDEF